jgi:hypothetical protein
VSCNYFPPVLFEIVKLLTGLSLSHIKRILPAQIGAFYRFFEKSGNQARFSGGKSTTWRNFGWSNKNRKPIRGMT